MTFAERANDIINDIIASTKKPIQWNLVIKIARPTAFMAARTPAP
jgi:exoribonuclease II